jgi:hypothetical protein
MKQNGVNFDTSRGVTPLCRARVNCTIKDATIKDATIKDVTIKGATIKDATIKDANMKIGALMNQMNSRRADDNYDSNNPTASQEEDTERVPLHITFRCDANLHWSWWGHMEGGEGGICPPQDQ